jgi:hypothetical protein
VHCKHATNRKINANTCPWSKLSQEGLNSTIAIFHILFNRKLSGEVAKFLDLENGK